jgi:ADP-heptose:LPS heptosyltransferase
MYRNILLIKPGAIGDLLQLTPTIRALKGKYPAARLSILVGTAADAEMFLHNPHVDATVVYNRRGEHKSFKALLGLWRRLRRERYDLVLNFQRSNLKAWLLAAAAFPCRVLVYHKARGRVVHAVENHLEALAPLGVDPARADKGLEFFVGPEAEGWAGELLGVPDAPCGPIIALNPGASHAVNRWSPSSFASLADRLARELSARVVVVGGRDDVPLGREIGQKAMTGPVIMTGTTTLLQLGALLKRCTLIVTGDTGPMHMATAVGTRVVALFGAADPARTGPVGRDHRVVRATGVPCVPCRSRRCTNAVYLECMEKITVDEVFAAIASMIGEGVVRP